MSYNNSVLIGNWSEERLKNESEFKLFLRKRDRRELLLQRSRTLFSNLLKERPLAISGTFVLFGFNVQLVASDMPAKLRSACGKSQYGLAMSSLVSERQVDYMQNINDGCLMTLSPITTPCCRNTFVILSTKDESTHGEKMNYGDEFFLRAENYGDPDAVPLYVRFTPEATPGPADHMPIRLSATKDSNCRWTTMPLLPADRLERLGSPVKTGAKLIVKNCVADKSLCVMNQNWMQTFFGPYKLNIFLEQMKKGDLMLARFRKMSENLNKPTILTQSSSTIGFGAKISLLAPHVPASDSPDQDRKGLLLGGRISSNDINYSQDLEDGCSLAGFSDLQPAERSTFIITSADYCNRENESLKYNQEFLLTLSSTAKKKVPLYIRYDPNPIPGLCGMYPLYLSKHAVSNTRWRVLPTQSPNITRFEQEGNPINVNTDVVINHCATNVNLGINVGCWAIGFYGKFCVPIMKTCLDVYGREQQNNIWQIYIPIAK
ncbi:cilia- and flagella-associated protein 161 isoform X2 [Achroia grisella]|uniref:cilia- and flagella-associated protein 161 isoform X2 n=1 Tax=Achroia grisella TaxID=688607 RepID=UPI0027D25967|nr:cilia- and flagella-associated protein 161 isoform X2 [Achroia grisella]